MVDGRPVRKLIRLIPFALLALVAVVSTGAAAGPSPYRRADWGEWRGTCPNTRTRVLMRDAKPAPVAADPSYAPGPPTQPGYLFQDGGCRLSWVRIESPYTGKMVNDPAHLQVDHVLAVEEANRAGGWRWSRQKKNEFYNWPYNHLAVEASVNAAKGSRPPPAWQPRQEFLCRYLELRGAVRAAWQLRPPGDGEARFMRETLERCPPGGSTG